MNLLQKHENLIVCNTMQQNIFTGEFFSFALEENFAMHIKYSKMVIDTVEI